MGHDKESVAGPRLLKMFIDLKVTNEIHSSEFAKSHYKLPSPMGILGKYSSQSLHGDI